MKNIRKILALVLALGMILVLAACKSGTDTAAPEEAAADSNTLIMATSADFPPYEFMENSHHCRCCHRKIPDGYVRHYRHRRAP